MTSESKIDMNPSFLTPSCDLYDEDYYLWLVKQAQLLKSGEFQQVDLGNLVEELEDMGRSERRSIRGNLVIVLLHLLKYQFQPEQRSQSWQASLIEHRLSLRDGFEESPSLRQLLEDGQWIQRCYEDACKRASKETNLPLSNFLLVCPYTTAQMLDEDFLPGDR